MRRFHYKDYRPNQGGKGSSQMNQPQLSNDFVRKMGEKIGRHPTTDDLVWYFRGGRLGTWGTGDVVPAPHIVEEKHTRRPLP